MFHQRRPRLVSAGPSEATGGALFLGGSDVWLRQMLENCFVIGALLDFRERWREVICGGWMVKLERGGFAE